MCTRQDSDSDWAPEVQGAANVEKSEEEALKVLLQPNFVKETSAELLGLQLGPNLLNENVFLSNSQVLLQLTRH